jgi:DNA-binding NarL/FixJ family response regulator
VLQDASQRSARPFVVVYLHPMKPANSSLRVVLADDHHFFREGLRGMLAADDIAVVGEAVDGPEAVTLSRKLLPDVVLMDLRMPRTSGTQALREILEANPGTRVLVLTVSADRQDVLEALAAGACGYMLKDTRTAEILCAIRLVAGGHAVASREVMLALVEDARAHTDAAEQAALAGLALSDRELQVIRLIAEGADNATIGAELSISRHTVKQYVTNIFEKLGVHSRVEAAVYAVRKGLV